MKKHLIAIASIDTISRWFFALLLVMGFCAATSADAQTKTDEENPISTLNLLPFYDLLAEETSQFGTWEVVPTGLQEFDGVPYQVDGLIRLYGEIPPPHGTVYRDQVEGIRIGKTFEALYLLHGTGWTTEDGVEIASVTFHYEDGSTSNLPIIYGHHVRDWWRRDSQAPTEVSDPGSKVAWEGEHRGIGLRFYQSILLNPHPDKEVRTLDILSSGSAVTPAIAAMSIGPAGHGSFPTKSRSLTESKNMTRISIEVLDASTGDPVGVAGFNMTYCDENTCRYLGAFLTDHAGQKELSFPAGELRSVHLSVLADGYYRQERSWSRAGGDDLPAAFTVELNKDASGSR